MITLASNQLGRYNTGSEQYPATAAIPAQVVGVRIPTKKMQADFEAWWRPEYADWFWPNPVIGTAGKMYQRLVARPSPPPKLGVLHWPTGALQWGTFYCIVTKADLDIINTWTTGNGYDTFLRLDDGKNYIDVQMIRLSPRPLWVSDENQQAYLLCLVDQRYRWHQLRTYNDDYIDTGSPNVWAGSDSYGSLINVVGQVLGALPEQVFFSCDIVPSAYLSPDPERWHYGLRRYDGRVAAEYLEAICTTIQSRLVFGYGYGTTIEPPALAYPTYYYSQDVTGFYYSYLKRPDTARTTSEANWAAWSSRVRMGGQIPFQHLGYSLPQNVYVTFGGPSAYSTTIEVAYSSTGIAASGLAPVFAVGSAYIEADLNNTATSDQKNAWAMQAATDWYNWRIADRVDAVFNGLVPWQPSGAEAAIEWTAIDDPLDFTTRVIPHPYTGGQILRDDDRSHLTLVQANAPVGDPIYSVSAGTAVRWTRTNSDDGSGAAMQAQGTYTQYDPVGLSVPGEFPVQGHVYLGVRQAEQPNIDGTSLWRSWYVGAPRGYALILLGSRIGSAGSPYYNGTAFIADGTNLRNVGPCYVMVRGTQHQLLKTGDYYEAFESGQYTSSSVTRRLFTLESQSKGSVYPGGVLADGVTAEPLFGTIEGLPGTITADIISSISLSITPLEGEPYNFTATVTIAGSTVQYKLGVSPENFVNGMVTATSPLSLSSTTTFSVPPPP